MVSVAIDNRYDEITKSIVSIENKTSSGQEEQVKKKIIIKHENFPLKT
jgi:hypothetical protein